MYSTRSSGSTNKFHSLPSISFVTNITQCFHVYKAMDGHFCATHAYTTQIHQAILNKAKAISMFTLVRWTL